MLKNKERSVILSVTLGSMFEWFEVFLFSYWAPLMSKSFSDVSVPFAELLYAIMLLTTGLIARPIGGLLFGHIGDRWGRKVAFILSIIAITLPSFLIAIMPSFSTWAYASLIYLGVARFIQGIPAGGELPGALCLLSESACNERKQYMCSYLFVGPQIGQILSVLLCFGLQHYLSLEQLISWGWRVSFFISGIIGIVGFFFRRRIEESPVFANLKIENKIEEQPLKLSLKYHKKRMAAAFFMSVFEVVGFFIIYFYLFENSSKILKIAPKWSQPIYLIYLISLTVVMPLLGRILNKFEASKLLKISAIGTLIVSPAFYFSIFSNSSFIIFTCLTFLILLLCIQFSLLPSYIAGLFPPAVRFTCLGFSFNIADGVVGSFTPYIGGWLTKATGDIASFSLLFPLTAVVFLIASNSIKTSPVQR